MDSSVATDSHRDLVTRDAQVECAVFNGLVTFPIVGTFYRDRHSAFPELRVRVKLHFQSLLSCPFALSLPVFRAQCFESAIVVSFEQPSVDVPKTRPSVAVVSPRNVVLLIEQPVSPAKELLLTGFYNRMSVRESEKLLRCFHGRKFLAYCSIGVKGYDWTRRKSLMSFSAFTPRDAFLPFVPCGAAFLEAASIRFAYKFFHFP